MEADDGISSAVRIRTATARFEYKQEPVLLARSPEAVYLLTMPKVVDAVSAPRLPNSWRTTGACSVYPVGVGIDGSGPWLYTHALLAFQDKDAGTDPIAKDAWQANDHVLAVLAGTQPLVASKSGYITMGGGDAGLLSKEKLLAGDIPAGLAGGEGEPEADVNEGQFS